MIRRNQDMQILSRMTADDSTTLYRVLEELSDPAYLDFNRRITPDLGQAFGVRLPDLRRILQAIKKNPQAQAIWEWLYMGESFEERMLAGMILPELDDEFQPTYQRLIRFLPRITNWALCDTTAGAFKAWSNRHKEALWEALPGFFHSMDPWTRRFGVVLLLHFQTPEYLKEAEELIDTLCDERAYYVLMGVAWVMSYYFFESPDAVSDWLRNYPNDEAVNLTIRKIGESRKGSADLQTGVKNYKR